MESAETRRNDEILSRLDDDDDDDDDFLPGRESMSAERRAVDRIPTWYVLSNSSTPVNYAII